MDAAFRDDPADDSARWLDGLDRARELAAACPDARVVSVCDREGDFRQLLARAAEHGDAILVRASRSAQQRVLATDGRERCLREHAAALPAIAVTETAIPASGGSRARKERTPDSPHVSICCKAGGSRARKERTARLEIRAAEVALLPPRKEKGAEPLSMLAVSATETDAPDGAEPLHWLLPASERPAEGEADAVRAAEVLDWYRRGRTVETWFRTLKSGTRIKDRRLNDAEDLRKCLAFDAVTAVHVADLTMNARERPETPATEVFPEEDIDLLHTLLEAQGHKGVERIEGDGVPAVRDFVIDLGRLVGAHPTKRQPLPGVKKVWQGLERLNRAIKVRDALARRRRRDALGERKRE